MIISLHPIALKVGDMAVQVYFSFFKFGDEYHKHCMTYDNFVASDGQLLNLKAGYQAVQAYFFYFFKFHPTVIHPGKYKSQNNGSCLNKAT